MRHTIRGLIIKDRKVLLVNGYDAKFYWTPGGGIELGESPDEALRREILEELGVAITSLRPYASYEYEDQRVENFLIEIKGEIVPGSEITTFGWYASTSPIEPSTGFRDMVLPRLLQDNLID